MEGREGSIEQGMAGSPLAQSRMHSKHIRIQECSMNSAKFKILGQKDFLQAPDYSGKCEKDLTNNLYMQIGHRRFSFNNNLWGTCYGLLSVFKALGTKNS